MPVVRDDEEALRAEIVRLAREYGRYGYRRITALLRRDGWQVNHKRVERIWRQEGLTGSPLVGLEETNSLGDSHGLFLLREVVRNRVASLKRMWQVKPSKEIAPIQLIMKGIIIWGKVSLNAPGLRRDIL